MTRAVSCWGPEQTRGTLCSVSCHVHVCFPSGVTLSLQRGGGPSAPRASPCAFPAHQDFVPPGGCPHLSQHPLPTGQVRQPCVGVFSAAGTAPRAFPDHCDLATSGSPRAEGRAGCPAGCPSVSTQRVLTTRFRSASPAGRSQDGATHPVSPWKLLESPCEVVGFQPPSIFVPGCAGATCRGCGSPGTQQPR